MPSCPWKSRELCNIPQVELPESADQTEMLLVRRVSTGDGLAFELLYDRVSTRLFSFAVYIVRSHADAEDVLQDAFLQIWKRAHTYRPEIATPFAWMAGVVRHKAIDRLRARSLHADKLECEWEERRAEPSSAETGLSATMQHEAHVGARESLKRLSQGERSALELVYFSGLTHVQIAAALRLPVGTIKARIRRGLFKLRRISQADGRPLTSVA